MSHHRRCFHLYHHLRRGCSSQCLQPMYRMYLIRNLCLIQRYHQDLWLHCGRLLHPKNHCNSLSGRSSSYTPSWRPRKNIFTTPSSNINTTNDSSRNGSQPCKNNIWTWLQPFHKTNLPPQKHRPLLQYQPHQKPRNFCPLWCCVQLWDSHWWLFLRPVVCG